MSKRTTKASRAASLKGWRTRRKMKEARSITEIGLDRYQDELERSLDDIEAARRRALLQVTGHSIDLLPKVEW